MITYKYRMPWGELLKIQADLTRAESPIRYLGVDSDGDERWQLTPYQTASASHREVDMLRLVVTYLGAEWYADPSSEESRETQLETALAGAQRIV